MPRVCGLCGSSSVSHFAWCLRWIATHSLVTMPVVSQSQKRKKCDGSGCRSSARCAWPRCRKIVTAAIVMCVVTSVKARISQPLNHEKPWRASRPKRRTPNSAHPSGPFIDSFGRKRRFYSTTPEDYPLKATDITPSLYMGWSLSVLNTLPKCGKEIVGWMAMARQAHPIAIDQRLRPATRARSSASRAEMRMRALPLSRSKSSARPDPRRREELHVA